MTNETISPTTERPAGGRAALLPVIAAGVVLPLIAALIVLRLLRSREQTALNPTGDLVGGPTGVPKGGPMGVPVRQTAPDPAPLSASPEQSASAQATPSFVLPARTLLRAGLILVGVMIPLVIAALLLSSPGSMATAASPLLPTVEGPCMPAAEPADWALNVNALVSGYHPACLTRQWGEAGKEFFVEIRHNNYGLHDSLLTLAKPPGVFRVLILGDSFPQGWEVPLEAGFPWLTEGYLSTQLSRPIEVINLSIHAYGTDSELLLYAALGWQFDADLVILSVYAGNDIRDNQIMLEQLQYGYRLDRAFFTLDANGDLLLHNKRHSSGAPILLDPALYPDAPAWQWLTTQQAQDNPAPEFVAPPEPVALGEPPSSATSYPVDMGLYVAQNPDNPAYPVWEEAWALTEALIVQLRDLVEAHGSRFAVMVIPDRRAIHPADWEALVRQYPDLLATADPLAPATRIAQIAAAHGIPALDLTGALRGWAVLNGADARLYYAGDGHFNADGHRVTAETLTAWLLENRLVP